MPSRKKEKREEKEEKKEKESLGKAPCNGSEEIAFLVKHLFIY